MQNLRAVRRVSGELSEAAIAPIPKVQFFYCYNFQCEQHND
ncbi:hypothetical protein [Myxacorys almedinensis]|nr:hypothetical protein [Myxacorys almedinensis]